MHTYSTLSHTVIYTYNIYIYIYIDPYMQAQRSRKFQEHPDLGLCSEAYMTKLPQ